jgi:sugar phosphate isomerase/epimerase
LTHISIQLWPARQVDLAQALSRIARLGYDSVQPYPPLFADDCPAFKRMLDDHALCTPSVHMELSDLESELRRWTDMAHLLGATSIVIPHLREGDRLDTADDWNRLGDALARTAGRVRAEGLRIAWANHDREYRLLPGGTRPIDLVLSSTDVDYEPVLGWLTRTGQDTAAELERYGSRIRTLRMRDWDGRRWTPIGEGLVGYGALWPRIAALPVLGQVIVDDDLPSDFFDFARRSFSVVIELAAWQATGGRTTTINSDSRGETDNGS